MCGHDRLQGAARSSEAGSSLDYLDPLDSEIRTYPDSKRRNTLVKELPWTAERNDDAIEHVCEGYALDIKARKQSVYDFWTGTIGICDGWIPSDLKRLAAQKAQQ